jgi:hypothetical protein
VDLSSDDAQKYFTSTSFSFQLSSTFFCINLLPSHVVHVAGKEKVLVHNLLFNLLLKELKFILSGFGNNRILSVPADAFSVMLFNPLKNS